MMKTYVSGVKFERIDMDITGPSPKSENGYVYIIVVVDYFTREVNRNVYVAEYWSEKTLKDW